MSEEWRAVVGREDLYEVSSLGRIRSKARVVSVPHQSGAYKKSVRERIMKPLSAVGCMYVNLNPGHEKRKIHHIVLEAFVGPRPDGAITRHLNGDYADNRLANIAYGTQTENRIDAVRHDNHKISRSVVEAIRADTGSSRKLAKKYGVSRAYVRLIKANRTRTEG